MNNKKPKNIKIRKKRYIFGIVVGLITLSIGFIYAVNTRQSIFYYTAFIGEIIMISSMIASSNDIYVRNKENKWVLYIDMNKSEVPEDSRKWIEDKLLKWKVKHESYI